MNKENTNNCQEPIDLLISQMEEGDFGQKHLEQLIQTYPSCEAALLANYELWQNLATMETPVPRPEMSIDFYKKLQVYSSQNRIANIAPNSIWTRLKNWNKGTTSSIAWAFGVGLFLLGFFAAQLFRPNHQQAQIDRLAQQIKDLKNSQEFDVNLSQSVVGRMKDIHFVRQMENPNAKILQALNTALCNDPNINIRLSAIESLVHFSDDPNVMEILIKAIPQQNSSLVQLELAEVMIQLEEKRSAAAWKELLESGEVELDVKLQLEESLQELL